MAKREETSERAAATTRLLVEGKLAAYRDALAILVHHTSICSEAYSLAMDTETTLLARIAELESAGGK